jgi:hypothetical protein
MDGSMKIELNENVQNALERAAAAAGMDISDYANLLIREQIAQDHRAAKERVQAVDALMEHMNRAAATSGRLGRSWREFIHEGHPE